MRTLAVICLTLAACSRPGPHEREIAEIKAQVAQLQQVAILRTDMERVAAEQAELRRDLVTTAKRLHLHVQLFEPKREEPIPEWLRKRK